MTIIRYAYNINVTYMLDAETDLRYQSGHWPVLHGCTTWDHVLFVLDGWNWPSSAIALTSATSIQSTCYICCLRACASYKYICCIAARATYICCISAGATCTRCLDWPVRSHWPTHPLQEVWLTGEQIRSRLSTSPNLTQAVLSARVKAARKQQQQKTVFPPHHHRHRPPIPVNSHHLLNKHKQLDFLSWMTSREYLTSHNLQPLGEVQRCDRVCNNQVTISKGQPHLKITKEMWCECLVLFGVRRNPWHQHVSKYCHCYFHVYFVVVP